MMASNPEWPQICNFRQITGTTLYPSRNINEALEEEVKKLTSLNIHTILDLRTEMEIRLDKKTPLDENYIRNRRKAGTPDYEINPSTLEKLIHEE